MPRRILAGAFAAVLVTLTLGSSATAKGPDSATVSGPGIGTKELTWMHRDTGRAITTLTEVTHFWDGADVAAWEVDPPPGDLGGEVHGDLPRAGPPASEER